MQKNIAESWGCSSTFCPLYGTSLCHIPVSDCFRPRQLRHLRIHLPQGIILPYSQSGHRRILNQNIQAKLASASFKSNLFPLPLHFITSQAPRQVPSADNRPRLDVLRDNLPSMPSIKYRKEVNLLSSTRRSRHQIQNRQR